MNSNIRRRPTRTLVRLGLGAAAASLLVLGVAQLPANAAAKAASPPYTTGTTIKSSVIHPVTGQAVTFTATVAALHLTHPPVPTGQVVFTITGADSSTVNCDAGDTVALTSGTAACGVSAGLLSSISPYSVSAVYTDTADSNFIASSGTLTQAVTAGPTATVLTSSSNPSVTGQPVTFTAAVAPSGGATGTLAGSVVFTGVTCDSGNTVPVVGGFAQCAIAGGLLSSGSPFNVAATYGSDPNFATSVNKVKQTVSRSGATVTLSASPNTCNGNLCTAGQGTPVSLTATVTSNAPSVGTPVGPVVFSVLPAGSKTSLTCDGGNSVPVTGGQATCTFANGLSSIVYYTITATLADPNYQTASATLYENSARSSTNTTVDAPKNVTAGETFAVTATVTAIGSASTVPTGQVDITVCGENSNGGNGCQGGPVSVAADGTAQFVVGGGEYVGSYSYYATYLGDQNYYGSTAKRKALVITRSPTSIAITSSENPSLDGDGVVFTATLTAANGSGGSTLVGPPSGTLDFTITGPAGSYTCDGPNGNSIPLDNGQADEGVATCFLPPGTLTDSAAPLPTGYTVHVGYTSDGEYGSSVNNITQTVVPLID